MARRRPILVALLLALALPALPANAQDGAQDGARARQLAEVRLHAIDLLANEPTLPLPIRQRRDALRAYYADEGGALLWIGTDRAEQLTARLADAEADGLQDADYPGDRLATLAQAIDETDARSQAVIELHFSAAFLEYASDLSVGRFLPHKVDPNFFLTPRSLDQLDALKRLGAGSVDTALAALQPQAPDYAALRDLLARYRALAVLGGWSPVPLGDTLKPGMSDGRVPALRERLALTDAADPEPAAGGDELFDDGLVEAVKRFQGRHGLDADGVVGPATIVALNVPVEARIENIVLAMERWRWMPAELGDRHVIVNIAGFELKLVEGGAALDRMNVVVGKPYSRTPVFSDAIRYLEFNPYWNVPTGLAIKEELPRLRANPAARAAAGFEAVRGNEVYSLTSIDWNQVGPGNFPFMLRQRPGANNALGRVKFMFPNSHDVYLHDTPSRELFSRSARAFSHGCIRLQRPLDLAVEVLQAGGVDGWTRQRIDRVVASQERTVVNLAEPLPVHLTYLTAWVDGGAPNFRADVYEHDAKLQAALDGRALAW